jgi:hypothetical protein
VQLHQHRVPQGVQELVVAPLGDIQWAGLRRKNMIALKQLKDHIARCIERGAWFIGMGDYIDFASPSNRQRLKAAALYETAEMVVEDAGIALVEELVAEVLAPTKGRWLGMLSGHHFAVFQDGSNSDHYLCRLLKAPFLGTAAIVQLAFQTHDGTRGYDIWAHHGAGGGSKAHAPILKLENLLPYWDADLFLIGHMTKVAGAPVKRIHARFGGKGPASLQERTIHLVGTGGWLKGYAEGAEIGGHPQGGYVEQKMLNPVALGAPVVVIKPKTKWLNGGGAKCAREGLTASRAWEPIVRVEL